MDPEVIAVAAKAYSIAGAVSSIDPTSNTTAMANPAVVSAILRTRVSERRLSKE